MHSTIDIIRRDNIMRFTGLSAPLLLLVVSDITTVAQDPDYKPEHGVECGVGGE
jgi:hypothetical protein